MSSRYFDIMEFAKYTIASAVVVGGILLSVVGGTHLCNVLNDRFPELRQELERPKQRGPTYDSERRLTPDEMRKSIDPNYKSPKELERKYQQILEEIYGNKESLIC